MSSLPDLPDPASITDGASAADALSSALVAAATANRTLSVASADEALEHGPRHARAAVPPTEWEMWLREFHRLLVKIAVKHSEIVSWSVTVGTDFSLTVNFATAKHDSGIPRPGF